MANGITSGSSEWHSVLAEVRRQMSEKAGGKDSGHVWHDLTEDASTSPDKQASPRWHQQHWAKAFDILFFQAPPCTVLSEQPDDLLFFVYLDAYQANEPYIVRRKGKALPTELLPGGSISYQIDWKRSVLLNLVTQTSYSMTVSACPRDQLHSIGSGQQLVHGVIEVRKAVYASTTKSQLNLSNQKVEESNPTLTYPDMSFAVDNFEEAFESLLLTQQEYCYLVLLTATGGMSLRDHQAAASSGPQSQQGGANITSHQQAAGAHAAAGAPSGLLLPPGSVAVSTNQQLPAAAGATTAAVPSGLQLSPGSTNTPLNQQSAAVQGAEAEAASPQHPLSSSSQSRPATQPASQAVPAAQQIHSKAGRHRERMLFSGFVSYEQLEQKLLGPKKGPWWQGKFVDGPHAVRMRGPGGVGCADVAVTCLARPRTDDASSGAVADPQSLPPTSPTLTWEELRGGASPSPSTSPAPKQKQGFLGSALGAAAHVVKLVANASPEKQDNNREAGYDMRCALMNLTLPMESLAHQLLQ